MTNAEKYLKDGVDLEEFSKSIMTWYFGNYAKANDFARIKNWAEHKIESLTEDERTILRNIKDKPRYIAREKHYRLMAYDKVEKDGTSRSYENGKEMSSFSHLFQFIKERRRILNRGTVERRIKMKRTIKLTMVFKEGTEKENTFGTDEIAYEIYYFYETGIMEIDKIESFGDRRLVGSFKDKTHSREMLDILLEIADMDYETFKSDVLDKCETEKNIV